MHIDADFLKAVLAFITGGGLLAVVSQSVKVYRAIRAGIPVREQKVRLDIVKQRDLALAYCHTLREALVFRGCHPAELPPWPAVLKETQT